MNRRRSPRSARGAEDARPHHRHMVAKDPDDRYQSARDLLHELKWVASGWRRRANNHSGHEAGAHLSAFRVDGRGARAPRVIGVAAQYLASRLHQPMRFSSRSRRPKINVRNTCGRWNRHRSPAGGVARRQKRGIRCERPEPIPVMVRSIAACRQRPIPGTEEPRFLSGLPIAAPSDFREREVEGSAHRRRDASRAQRCTIWARRHVESRERHVFAPTTRCAAPCIGAGGAPQSASVLDKEYGEWAIDSRRFSQTAVTFSTQASSARAVRHSSLHESRSVNLRDGVTR